MTQYQTREQRTAFYKSNAWRGKHGLRNRILTRDNYECARCKAEGKVTTHEHATLEIDHIKEIEFHPELATEEANLQILCKRHHNIKHDRFIPKSETGFWREEKW